MELSPLTAILLAPAAILLVAGAVLLLLFVLGNVMQVDVHFESSDGKWADTEDTFKAYDYRTVLRSFEAYRDTTREPVSLVRTTAISWRNIQLWPTYLMNPKWRVPYTRRTILAHRLLPTTPRVSKRGIAVTTAASGEATNLFDACTTTSAVEYLDQCLKHNSPASLVDMLGYIDHKQKAIPSAEEINQALAQRATVRVGRENRAVFFTQEGSRRAVTEEDLEDAYSAYREKFRGTPNQ